MSMLTQCPHCQSVFRLNASALAVARGFVTCGDCGQVFFSLDRLADEPHQAEPAALPPQKSELPRVLMHPVPETEVLESLSPAPAMTNEQALDELPLADVPPVLRPDLSRRQQRAAARRARRWARVSALLLLLFAAQVLWQARLPLMQAYPVVTPWVQRFCAAAGCAARVTLPPAQIDLLARDVREHPQYAGALLVNATLVNRESQAAPYPVLQLAFLDRNGEAVGVRRFLPRDYLDASVDPAQGMPPSRPVQILLELQDPGARAAGFEFNLR